jgi:DNA ligase-1
MSEMRLAELVEASDRVGATRKRLAKIDALAACLASLAPDEVGVGAGFLMGEVRQGRVGLGPAAVREARPAAAPQAELSVHDVDAAFSEIAAASGPSRKRARLGALLARATAARAGLPASARRR